VTPEPLTPVAVEQKLRQLVNDLSRAQIALAQARDDEVDRRHEYERARRKALLSGECPKVTRNGWTTSERDAWVEEQCTDLAFLAAKTTVVREAAQDKLRTLLATAEVCRSLSASVRASYEMAGVPG
jgi:hypothetical protein